MATASQVLNGYPNISEKTRKKVWAAKEALGYLPNAHARSLRVNQGRRQSRNVTGNLALVVVDPEPNPNFYMNMVHGFSSSVQERDLHPLVLTVAAAPPSEREMPASLRNRSVDGLLLTGIISEAVLERFMSLGIPCVVLGNEEFDRSCCVVKPDVVAGTLGAMKRLFELGHTAVSLVSQRMDTCYHKDIRDAYRLAYSRQGIVPREEWIRNIGGPLVEPGGQLEALLGLSPRPTALLFTNTRSAGQSFDLLQKKGVRVPADMSMITFSGTSETEIRGSIDRIVVDNEALARFGVRTLLDRILASEQTCVSVSIPCVYMDGGSCAPAPSC